MFAFDFRNHGTSDCMNGYTPRTWATQYEVFDVLGAVNLLRSDVAADPEGVALIGLSRGGSAALSAASRSDGIWAIVTDGAFVSRWVTAANIRRFMPQFVRRRRCSCGYPGSYTPSTARSFTIWRCGRCGTRASTWPTTSCASANPC